MKAVILRVWSKVENWKVWEIYLGSNGRSLCKSQLSEIDHRCQCSMIKEIASKPVFLERPRVTIHKYH